MNRYVDYVVNDNIKALIKPEEKQIVVYSPFYELFKYLKSKVSKKSEPRAIDLINAGENLKMEYYDAIASDMDKKGVYRKAKANIIESKIERINSLISLLRGCYDERLVNALNKLGIKKKISKETLQSDLNKAEDAVKSMKFKLKQLREHEDRIANPEQKSKLSFDLFEKILISIDKKLTMDSISAYRFALLYRLKADEVARLEANGRKNR